MTTIPANDIRIPAAAREALARHEEVMVLSHGRPVFVIVNPDDYQRSTRPAGPAGRRGRPMSEALAILANAPFPDPGRSMGTLLDTTIFVRLERELRHLAPERARSEVVRRFGREFGREEETGIAAITASELLHGAHRATPAHRPRRAAFVEVVLEAFPPISFDLVCARAHALLWAELAAAGTDIGAHDRLIAATALAGGWRVATTNLRHFSQIPGLEVVDPDLAA